MNNYSNYPPEYSQGYQPQQPPVYHPQQPVPPSYPQPGYGMPQQQMAYQQPMYAPQINVNMGYQRPQVSMGIRMLYFIFIGSWLGICWLGIALGFCCSIVGLPIGLMMLNRLGAVMTLSRR